MELNQQNIIQLRGALPEPSGSHPDAVIISGLSLCYEIINTRAVWV